MNVKKIVINKTIDSTELSWAKVIQVVQKRYQYPYLRAHLLIDNFQHDIGEPFAFRWMFKKSISKDEYNLLLAVCEVHGCDEIRITRGWQSDLFRIAYFHKISFSPISESNLAKVFKAIEIDFIFFNRVWKIDSLYSAIPLYATLALIGIFLFFPTLLLFLYCFSVFYIFLNSPVTVAKTAFSNLPIWLALLSFSVVLAAIVGGMIRRSFRLVLRFVKGCR